MSAIQLYGDCYFCASTGFLEPDKLRSKFCGGSGLHKGYQQGLHDLFFQCGGEGWKNKEFWFKTAPISTWGNVNYDDGRDGAYQRETVTILKLGRNNLSGVIGFLCAHPVVIVLGTSFTVSLSYHRPPSRQPMPYNSAHIAGLIW